MSELMAAKFCLAHTNLALRRYMNQITTIDSRSPIVSAIAFSSEKLFKKEGVIQFFINARLVISIPSAPMGEAVVLMSVQKRIFDRFVAISSLEADSPVIRFYKDQSAVLDRAIAGMSAFLTESVDISNLEVLRDDVPAIFEDYISGTVSAMVSGYSESTVATIVPEEVQIDREWTRRAPAPIRISEPTPVDLNSSHSNLPIFSSAPSRPVAGPDRAFVETFFNRIKQIAPTPELMDTNPDIEAQVRLIGQEIFDQKGHEGMVAVCEFNRQYKPYINITWNRIGSWLY